MTWSIAYVALIVAVNYGFSAVPLVHGWPPMSLVVGFIFIVRDFAQREIGHWIIVAMLVGGALSWLMADPFVALASVTAFLASESADWAVYSFTRASFRRRVLLSSLLSTPIDSVVFLAMIGQLTVVGAVAMILSKLVGLVVLLRVRREATV